jgi:hypothetical protein
MHAIDFLCDQLRGAAEQIRRLGSLTDEAEEASRERETKGQPTSPCSESPSTNIC